MDNREFELKIMINKKKHNELKHFAISKHDQINYYFDNNDAELFNNKQSLRIRECKNKYEITHKTKESNSENKGVLIMGETNIQITKKDFNDMISNKISINKFIDLKYKNLKYIGNLKTKRIKINLSEKMPLAELDYNEYNNISDYELEWEINKDIYVKALTILEKYGINIENNVIGKPKFVRFMETIKGEKNGIH